MSYFNPVFVLMYLSSFFIVLGGDSWFLLWVGLEVNMMSFIILVYGKSISKIEVCLKYFFIQGVGSAMLLMMLILKGKIFLEAVLLILSYKMGAGPFFFWFPSFCEGVSWASCILLMSLQKVVPFIFINMFVCMFVWLVLLMSMLIGVMGCFNEIKLKKFMAFSSIHYVGWMLLCTAMDSYLWIFYLVSYTMILLGVLMSIGASDCFSCGDVMKMNNPGLFIFSMLNMGGMPPMLGFFLKWWVFLLLLNYKVEIIWGIILMTIFMFYTYMRLVYPVLINYFFCSYFSWISKKYLLKNSKEWMYVVCMFFIPILGWTLL